jgi:membrane protein DedA with SNARE-associated domain
MELLHRYGYSLVFSAILLEQLGLPVPASPVLILAGALAAAGDLSFTLLVILASIGCVIGDMVWYFFGRYKGRRVLKTLCSLSLSPDSCVRKTENSFAKYGMNSLIFAKFVPGLNTIAPPMAGLVNSSFLSFIWRDLTGTLLYVLAFLIPGFFFEKMVFDITSIFEEIGKDSFALVIGLIAAYVLMKFVRLKMVQRKLYKARITPEELYRMVTGGEQLTILDLRSALKSEVQLPGAIRIHPAEIDQHLDLLSKEKRIVMYCT